MTQETARPTHELYIELCRMSGRGLTSTPEYRALNGEYQTAVDRAIGKDAVIRPANLPDPTRCVECGVPANNGTPGHPPLCYECVEIWYPSESSNDDD